MILKTGCRNLIFFILLLNSLLGSGANISGKIQLNNEWQPVLFMASINSPENLNVTSPDFNISKTFINPDGFFSFQNITLPSDSRFYRFYMVKNRNSLTELSLPGERFFIHFILDNSSNILFNAETDSSDFKVTSVSGDKRNQQLLNFQNVFFDKKQQFRNDLSKAQKDFLTINLENYIREFVDTTSNALVGLFALYQIEDKETDFLKKNDFYFNFQNKLNQQFPNSVYTEKYDSLLNDLIGFRQMVCEIPGVIPKWKDTVIYVESGLLAIFLLIIIILYAKLKQQKVAVEKDKNPASENIEKLTRKESEILELLSLGKSNKEIASELFIELSTVKSHLGRIYKQLNVTGRKEAIKYVKKFKNE